MTSRYQQEIAYIRAYLTDEEIQRRIDALSADSRHKSMIRWEGGAMTPDQLKRWAQIALDFHAVAVDFYNIYRDKDQEELRETVINSEYHKRSYIDQDMPEDLDDIETAAAEYAKKLYG